MQALRCTCKRDEHIKVGRAETRGSSSGWSAAKVVGQAKGCAGWTTSQPRVEARPAHVLSRACD